MLFDIGQNAYLGNVNKCCDKVYAISSPQIGGRGSKLGGQLPSQVMSTRTWTETPQCIRLKKVLQCAARSVQQIYK